MSALLRAFALTMHLSHIIWYKMIFYIEDLFVFVDAVVDCRSTERAF